MATTGGCTAAGGGASGPGVSDPDYSPANSMLAAWHETARGGARNSVEVLETVAPARSYWVIRITSHIFLGDTKADFKVIQKRYYI